MILTVGDSFTYGEELSNRTISAWPYLIGQQLNKTVTNLGKSGASNTYIFRTTIEAIARQAYDLVVVQWTDPSRIEISDSTGNAYNITANVGQKLMPGPCRVDWVKELYANYYSDAYNYKMWSCYVLALQDLFKFRKQPYVMINLAGLKEYYTENFKHLAHIWNHVDSDYFVGWPTDGILDIQGDCPRGSGGHPLELGHERIANEIAKYIRN